MKPKIIVLTTGGTIGHSSRTDGVAIMDFDPARLVRAIAFPDADIEFKSILHKGSMDIGPDDWVAIAQAVADAMALEPRGVVILHGTDTMHYTAAALCFMLRDLGVPVVMTGSMIPGGDSGSDAIANLRDAVAVAAQADFAEVCIVFSADAPRTKGVIIRGCRARKVHSHAIDAFASIDAPPIGTIADDRIVRSNLAVRPRASSRLSLATAVDRNVVLIKLTPNLEPGTLARLLEGASGAVLEGTGVGHIKTSLQPVIAQFGKPTVVGTQAAHGGERLGSYEVDRNILAIPNVIPAGDMTSETALVKLMWALEQGGDVGSIMRTSFAGEIGDLFDVR
jgi:glutamyl-tRNA(Gln) amidotransferase subunit D